MLRLKNEIKRKIFSAKYSATSFLIKSAKCDETFASTRMLKFCKEFVAMLEYTNNYKSFFFSAFLIFFLTHARVESNCSCLGLKTLAIVILCGACWSFMVESITEKAAADHIGNIVIENLC